MWCLAGKKVYLKLNDHLSVATDWSSEIHKRYKVSSDLAIWRLLSKFGREYRIISFKQ